MQQDKQLAMKEPSATEEQTVTEGKDGQFGYSELIQPEAGTPVELPETAKQEVERETGSCCCAGADDDRRCVPCNDTFWKQPRKIAWRTRTFG